MECQWTKRYCTKEVNADDIPYRSHVCLCRKRLRVAMLLSGICIIFSVIKMIVADNPNVNNHVHIVLGIGFYVNFVLAAYFYVQGIRHSRCCRCGRYVPVRRYNIGRILTGQMPLCPDCKLIVGVDFVVNTRKDEEMMAKGDSPRGHSNFSSISFYIRNRKFSIVPVLVL